VDVCFTDERFVPPADPRSNVGMVTRTLLSRVAIPPERVHAIPTEHGTPEECAARYEDALRALFGRADDVQATFDLTIMGIGTDGHTASLFPGATDALEESERWVLAVPAPPTVEVSQRITLTLPVLNRSRVMLFAASGEKKRAMVARALSPEPHSVRIPAGLAHGAERTDWYLDQPAAPGHME
jgi:6-phosphogluconolactonase